MHRTTTRNRKAKQKKTAIRINVRRRPDYSGILSLIKKQFKGLPSTPMPKNLSPMLATITDKAFDHADWLFEIKWDGYRSLAYINKGEVQLRSRKNLSFNQDYAPVVEALQEWGVNAVLDGEIVVLNKEGKADFEALQNYKSKNDVTLVYYVFDILWLDGYDLTEQPLYRRKEILQKMLPEHGLVRYSDSIEEFGSDFFELAKKNDLEGIVAKNKNSVYQPGSRTKDWLKLPTHVRQEFVIGGWTESESGRAFRSLLFGYYENDGLIYVGHSGGGFKDAQMKEIYTKLKAIETKKKPFVNEVATDRGVHWVKPQLVAEIKFATMTSAGKIRKPAIFLGFRKDKDPKDVRKEVELEEQNAKKTTGGKMAKKNRPSTSADSNWPKIEEQKISSQTDHEFEGHVVTLTNVEKKLWNDFTKAHLIMYYHSVAPWLLPHLKNRPLSLHIKPIAPTAPGFYIKDMEGRQPGWSEIFSMNRLHKKRGKRDQVDYLVANEEATLQWMLNLGCIDVNPWTSRASSPDQPDYIVIDLDPSDDDFSKAVETAMAAKQLFDSNKLKAFAKTSGKTGMHLFLPCSAFDFKQARMIAESICNELHRHVPSITTTEISVNSRGNKLYIDPNQNDFADTVAAPYSLRPFRIPSVSTPLEWREIKKGLDTSAFTTDRVITRLKKKGDLFLGVHDRKLAAANDKRLVKWLGA